jgi:Arc/MetJ-type ribon-helix-helix transcriptional regulator
MSSKTVHLRLNQQQLELIDKSIAAGEAKSREELIRRALREFAAGHVPPASGDAKERGA